MLSVAHTLISVPFGHFLINPLIIFVAAFLFHLVCDSLPHWNIYPQYYKKYPYGLVALDVGGGLLLAWLWLGSALFTLPVLAAIAGGNAPDVIYSLREMASPRYKKWFNLGNPFFKMHNSLQFETKKMAPGLIAQVLVVALAIYLVAWY